MASDSSQQIDVHLDNLGSFRMDIAVLGLTAKEVDGRIDTLTQQSAKIQCVARIKICEGLVARVLKLLVQPPTVLG